MVRPQPIAFVWDWVDVTLADGVIDRVLAMVPPPRYRDVAKHQFGKPGSEHLLEPTHERNMRFHKKAFAALHTAWESLPERFNGRWKDEEHFRKWLLVHCNYYKERVYKVSDVQTGKHIRVEDDYVDISVSDDGLNIIVRCAESQKPRDMDKERFEQSMKDILEMAANFVGVPVAQLMNEAGRSA